MSDKERNWEQQINDMKLAIDDESKHIKKLIRQYKKHKKEAWAKKELAFLAAVDDQNKSEKALLRSIVKMYKGNKEQEKETLPDDFVQEFLRSRKHHEAAIVGAIKRLKEGLEPRIITPR